MDNCEQEKDSKNQNQDSHHQTNQENEQNFNKTYQQKRKTEKSSSAKLIEKEKAIKLQKPQETNVELVQ